jgi:hypothetical protein
MPIKVPCKQPPTTQLILSKKESSVISPPVFRKIINLQPDVISKPKHNALELCSEDNKIK